MSVTADDGIYYQSIDVEIEITNKSTGENTYWIPKNLVVRRKQYEEQSDGVEMTVIPDPDKNPEAIISPGDEIRVSVGPKTSIAEDGDRNMVNEDKTLATIFTGIISSSRNNGDLTWKAFAFTHQLDILKTEISYSADQETNVETIVKEVIQKVADVNDIEIKTNVDISESEESSAYGGFTRLNPTGQVTKDGVKYAEEVRQLKPFTDTAASTILSKLSKSTQSAFWSDTNNVINFGPTKSAIHKLSWVISTDAGGKTPPYQSVRVIGDDIGVARGGWESVNLTPNPDDMTTTTASLLGGDGGETTVELGELVAPTFTYEDASIRTKEEANSVAVDIVNDLVKRSQEGTITIPGRPMIDLFDVVEMPDSFGVSKSGNNVGSSQHYVEEIIHRINTSDGFITEISVSGLLNAFPDNKYYKYVDSAGGIPQVELVDRTGEQEPTVELGETVLSSPSGQ